MDATPHYATREDLANLKVDLVERIAALETRLTWRFLSYVTGLAAMIVAAVKFLP